MRKKKRKPLRDKRGRFKSRRRGGFTSAQFYAACKPIFDEAVKRLEVRAGEWMFPAYLRQKNLP